MRLRPIIPRKTNSNEGMNLPEKKKTQRAMIEPRKTALFFDILSGTSVSANLKLVASSLFEVDLECI